MSTAQTEINAINDAILKLIQGKAVAKVTSKGRTVEYTSADLPQLREMRSELQAQVHRPRFRSKSLSAGNGFS